MKILVTGAGGMLGSEIIRKSADKYKTDMPDVVLGVGHAELDITDKRAVDELVDSFGPDCIIDCAAYTAVDLAEDEHEKCYAVNVTATEYLAEAAERTGASFIYVSTEYIFAGEGEAPYDIEAAAGPVNYYGMTKYLGERAAREKCSRCFIARTSWTYGINGKNFVKSMLNAAKTRASVTVVDDQIGSPTYVSDVADFLLELAKSDKYGIYHAVNSGYCSRYEMTKYLYGRMEIGTEVIPIKSSEYKAKARRPLNCRLSQTGNIENGFTPLRTWKDALKEFCEMYGDRL